jgi:hypothetical protein
MTAFDPDGAFEAYSGQMALLRWEQGRLGELAPLLERALGETPYLAPAFTPVLALALAANGRHAEAVHLLDQLGLDTLERPPVTMLRSGTTSSLAAACAALGHRELAPTALRFLGEAGIASDGIVDHLGVFYLGARDAYRGALLMLLDDIDGAITSLRRAGDVNSRVGAAVFAVKSKIDLAAALLARGSEADVAEATDLLDDATAVAARIGLPNECDRCDLLARQLASL